MRACGMVADKRQPYVTGLSVPFVLFVYYKFAGRGTENPHSLSVHLSIPCFSHQYNTLFSHDGM